MTGTHKIRLGFGAGLAIFFGLATAVVVRNFQWQADGRWIAHTNDAINQISSLLLTESNTENSAQRYVLTSDAAALANARSSAASAIRAAQNLAQFTSDNAVQRQNMRVLEPLLQQQK